MAMQFLVAQQNPDGSYTYSVWLDDSKTVDGQPDPKWVRQYSWGPNTKDTGLTDTEYQAMTLAEVKLLAAADLAALQPPAPPPAPLPVQGQTF